MNLDSQDGHDGFILEFEALSQAITYHLREQCPQLYEMDFDDGEIHVRSEEVFGSVFGEAEAGDF
jgi:homoserine O-acetyltransferase